MRDIAKPFAFWLTPEQTSHEKLSQFVNSLAARYQSPPFEPHLTLYFGTYLIPNTPLDIAQALSLKTGPISVQVERLKQTDFIFKSLFLQFAPHLQLTNMVETVSQRLQAPLDFQLDPHLSLMYADLSEHQKQAIIDDLTLDFNTIIFDSLKFVTPNPVSQDWGDIAGWQIEGEWKLTGGAMD